MADQPEKRRPGRPRKANQNPPLSVQLPDGHYEYLRYIVRVTRRLGATENDAAKFILIRELDKLMRGRYHKKGTPFE